MHPDQPAQREILLVQEQFWKALKTKDASLLATILAPTFVGRSPGEPDQTGEEFITTLTTFPVSISEIAGDAIEVHVFGEVAVLTGVQVARLELPDGEARSSRVMLSNVFRQEDLGWRMVLCHSFEVIQNL
jgi:ketosteroid isomerase-like protein